MSFESMLCFCYSAYLRELAFGVFSIEYTMDSMLTRTIYITDLPWSDCNNLNMFLTGDLFKKNTHHSCVLVCVCQLCELMQMHIFYDLNIIIYTVNGGKFSIHILTS